QGFAPDVLTHMAVGTSLATIAFTSISSVRAHHKLGAVRWPLLVWLTLGIIGGCVLGALTAAALSGPVLQEVIGGFAISVAVQMAFDRRPGAALAGPGRPTLGPAWLGTAWAAS